jgi:sugar O-acyltransferase (sialic acid O-acetyltransferase NeuD family)
MSERALYLLGGGGHGSVVLDALLKCGKQVTAITDGAWPAGHRIFGVPVAGPDSFLEDVKPDAVVLANGVGALPGNATRIALYRRWRERGFEFVSVVHPSAAVGQEVTLAAGCQVMAGAVLQCRVSLGENVVINTRASIDHDCRIAAHAFIAPGVVLCGGVTIGEEAFVGAGAVVLQEVSIGRGAIVGAGAIVTRSVPDGVTVMGNPAIATAKQI